MAARGRHLRRALGGRLAAHLASEQERRDFDRDVLARLGAYRGHGGRTR